MPIILRNTAERLPYEYEGATIYFHRLNYSERAEIFKRHNQRGQLEEAMAPSEDTPAPPVIVPSFDLLEYWQEAALSAIDGWDEQVYSADLQPIPVPSYGDPVEQRTALRAILEHFPPLVLQDIGQKASEETPDFLLRSWQEKYGGSSSLPSVAPDGSLPAAIAANNDEVTG